MATADYDTTHPNEQPPSLATKRGPEPTHALLSACEALTWIAFGTAIPMEKLGESERKLSVKAAGKSPAAAWLIEAVHELIEALRAGKLRAVGRRNGALEHEEISLTVFASRAIVVTWWNTIETEMARGPCFSDVQFQTADVLALWPPIAAGNLPTPLEIGPRMTGAPGRPSKSMDLIEAEFERRTAHRQVLPKLTDEAEALRAWLGIAHPMAVKPTTKTISNRLRAQHREYRTPEIIAPC